SSNGTPLTPAVSASITVALTRGPAGGTPRIAITYWEILYPFPGDLWGDDITISFRISNFTLVPPGRRESVPNEGRLRVLVDGLVFKDITTYEPAHFSDLPDGDHTVTMRLVDGAGQPLNPDASDSTRFRVEGEQKVAPIPDLSPYLLTAQLGLGAAIVGVLYVHDWRRKRRDARGPRVDETDPCARGPRWCPSACSPASLRAPWRPPPRGPPHRRWPPFPPR